MNTESNVKKQSSDFEEFLIKEQIMPFQIQKHTGSPDQSTPFTKNETDNQHLMLNNPSGPSGLSMHPKFSNSNQEASFLAHHQKDKYKKEKGYFPYNRGKQNLHDHIQ